MKKFYALAAALGLMGGAAQAQISFDPSTEANFEPTTVVMPASPLTMQVLFIGGVDEVQTLDSNGNPNGSTPAKEWHDFLGFTADDASNDLGWVSVNHERIQTDAKIGDGGGMTAFKVARDANTDSLVVVAQTLSDGRTGDFFNVDFVNTVGETGMNCGGIVSPVDGRIWTAEEWFRGDNASIYASGAGVLDTSDYTIAGSGIAIADGQTVARYENFNYMVEIDPREAVAIRKQYNWGRQPFEGGTVMPDNKTVYLGADATPGFLTKFVADVAGDFTVGTTYVYKQDDPNNWVEIDNSDFNNMLNFADKAVEAGATMFNRLEWVAYNPADGNVYVTETGRDNPASRWVDEKAEGADYAEHHYARALAQDPSYTPDSAGYWDYYGRVLKIDVAMDTVYPYLEGGPYFASVTPENYPEKHLSNPDGLSFMTVKPGTSEERTYMVVQEDLNGTSYGRMPDGISNRGCELFLLDMTVANPTVDDLVRITTTPLGSEVTGAVATPDGKSLLVNSQHPSGDNPFPFNHSLTFAINGFDKAAVSNDDLIDESAFQIYPNPVSRILNFTEKTDVAIFTLDGQRVRVANNTTSISVEGLATGVYVIKNKEGQIRKLIVE
ncbi:alkaline phosphatase PhoX [Pontibacter sp. G13]|uniref:alkaline phosphatase PhoX n=1 Tax=Pontibacter sp. G13 TaxID=3074898 RepID=UPI002889FB9A|nr:alkaline phosphatase PhoX [Pontibacter sp. G13]WNJ18944.1 DUF839 domain-containing protein [Pontibacter sp. G13]